MQQDVLDRLDRLEARVSKLESSVGATVSTQPRSGASTPAPASGSAAPPEHASAPPTAPAGPGGSPWVFETELDKKPPAAMVPPPPPVQTRAGNQPSVGAQTPAARATAKTKPGESFRLESLVGGWWFAVLGAVIVVAGLGFGVKLAWDAGWLRLSEMARVLVVAGFGLAMLGAGEVVLRKWGRAAALGLFAAGLGGLYVSAWSASGLYELVPVWVSFIMLAGVACAGIAVSLRAGLLSIGVVSLIGGYVAPLIARSPDPEPWALPAYLVALTLVGIGLGWWKRRYEPVRIVAWGLTTLVATGWFFVAGGDLPWFTLVFVLGLWCLHHADAFRRAQLGGSVPEGASEADEKPLPITPGEVFTLMGSVGLTAWALLLGTIACVEWGAAADWVPSAVLTVATGVLSLMLAGHLRVLTDRPRTPAERLGALLMMQSAGLLISTVALGVEVRWVRSLAWLAMGMAACAGARWMRSIALGVYGVVQLGLATSVIFLIGLVGVPAGWGRFDLFGLVVTPWTALVLAAGGCAIAASRVLDWRAKPERDRMEGIFAALCSVGVLVSGVSVGHAETELTALAWCWGLAGVVAVVCGSVWRRSGAEFGGLVLLGAGIVAWCGGYVVAGWDAFTGVPGTHPGLWVGLGHVVALLTCAWLGARLWRRRGWQPIGMVEGLGALAGVLALVATSLEVARGAEVVFEDTTAQRGAVSIWWGVFASGLLVLGAVRGWSAVRWCGLGLVLVAAGKAVIFDLATVEPAVRVASFLGLGLLMLVIAVMYTRASLRSKRASSGAQPPEEGG